MAVKLLAIKLKPKGMPTQKGWNKMNALDLNRPNHTRRITSCKNSERNQKKCSQWICGNSWLDLCCGKQKGRKWNGCRRNAKLWLNAGKYLFLTRFFPFYHFASFISTSCPLQSKNSIYFRFVFFSFRLLYHFTAAFQFSLFDYFRLYFSLPFESV